MIFSVCVTNFIKLVKKIHSVFKTNIISLKTHQKVLGEIFWLRVNEPNSDKLIKILFYYLLKTY